MTIQWTIPAVNDLEAIRDYIAHDSELYATSVVEKILNSVEVLLDFPMIGRIGPEANNPGIREIIFQNFRIMYRFEVKTIQIIAVIRGSRDVTQWPLKPWEIV